MITEPKSWLEQITLGHQQETITELRTTTCREDAHRLPDQTSCLAKTVTIRLGSLLGLCHHDVMRLIIRSLKEGSMAMGSSQRLNSYLEDTGCTRLHEAKVSLPIGWTAS